MKNKPLSALFLAGTLLAGTQALAGDMEAAMLSNTCAGCHGTYGASAGQAPVIAGLSEIYLTTAMKNYKEGTRYSTVMDRIAKGYDEAQLQAMSKFYAKQPWVNGEQTVDRALAKKGKNLHMTKGCIGCHGPNGISPMPTSPRLAGQYVDYMVLTMQQYQDPTLAIPPQAVAMRSMLTGMSNDDLKALANFYASQN